MWLVKWIGGPGSIGFLAMGCAMGLILGALGSRGRRIGRTWLLLLYTAYVVGGVPKVAHATARGLPAYPPLPLETVRTAHTLIVLGGDNAVGRVREAQRLLAVMPAPSVIVSGGAWIAERVVEDLPHVKITQEHSETTHEQIVNLTPAIRRASPGVVIVASRLQMPRVAALLRAQRLEVLLAPAPLDVEPPGGGWTSLVPRYSALRLTRDAFYERAALVYYARQGWIG